MANSSGIKVSASELEVRRDGTVLSGTFFAPADGQTPTPTIIVAHGAQMGLRSHWLYRHLVDTVSSLGVAVLVTDRRGSGRSGGDFETAAFDDLADDLLYFTDFLIEQSLSTPEKIGVWGFSQGGWVAPTAAMRSPSIRFLILVSSTPFSVADQMAYAVSCLLREDGFSNPEIAEATAVLHTVNDYYRGRISKEQLTAVLVSARENRWYARADLPRESDIPDHPENTKWYREISFEENYVESLRLPILILNGAADPWVDSARSLEHWRLKSATAETRLIRDANHYMVSGRRHGRYATEGEVVGDYTDLLKSWVSTLLQR